MRIFGSENAKHVELISMKTKPLKKKKKKKKKKKRKKKRKKKCNLIYYQTSNVANGGSLVKGKTVCLQSSVF
jgi:hypothetical protein